MVQLNSTGFITGVIRKIEKHLKKNHFNGWLICQLHANYLPLRYLFQHLDGKTFGSHGFSGLLKKQ
jgi:hypothetical protein